MELKEKYNKHDIGKLLKDAPTSGNVEIRMINPKKTGLITMRDYTITDDNGATDYRPFIDSNGNHRVAKYRKKKILRMGNENDRLEYVHLKNHPLYLTGSTAIFTLFNYEDEANDYVNLKNAEAKANAMINDFAGNKLRNLARVVQIVVRPGSSETVLKRALYEYADNKLDALGNTGALEILKQLESPEYETKVLLYNAMDAKIVEVKSGRYLFGQIGMGTTFDTSLQYLVDNPDIESELSKKLNFKGV
jgi:hypothetical protein